MGPGMLSFKRFVAIVMCVLFVFPVLGDAIASPVEASVSEAPQAFRGSTAGNREDLAIVDAMESPPGPAPIGIGPTPASPSAGAGAVLPTPSPSDSQAAAPPPPTGSPIEVVPAPDLPPQADRSTKGFDPETSTEDATQRTAFGTVFDNADGTTTAEIADAPQHYQLPDGSWGDIDAHFRPVDKSPGTFVSDQNSFQVHASAEGVNVDTPKGRTLRLSLVTERGLPDPVLSADASSVTYPEVWPGVDLRFTVSATAVTKELVIKRPGTKTTFELIVDGVAVSSDASGAFTVEGDAKDEVSVGSVTVFDNAGVPVPGAAAPGRASVDRSRSDMPVSTISVGADPEWLAALGPKDYPFVIDPWINPGPLAPYAYAYGRNSAGVDTACTTPNGYCSTVRVGRHYASGSYLDWRSIVAYDYLAYLPTAGTPSELIDAQILMTRVSGTSTPSPDWIDVRHASAYDWCGLYLYYATCGVPDSTSSGPVAEMTDLPASGGPYGLNITSKLSPYWVAGQTNVGWIFNGRADVYESYKSIDTSLYITFNRTPTISSISPAANQLYSITNPTFGPNVPLSVTASDPDGDTLSYRFTVTNSTASFNWTSGWISSASSNVQLPLAANEFGMLAEVWDGRALRSASTSFTVTDGAKIPYGIGSPFLVPTASPLVGSFYSRAPGGQALTWQFNLCETNTVGTVLSCTGVGAAQAQTSNDGNFSYKTLDFATYGWALVPGHRYNVYAYTGAFGTFEYGNSMQIEYIVPPVVTSGSERFPGQIDTLRPQWTTPGTSGTQGFNQFFFCVYDYAAPPTTWLPDAASCPVANTGWTSTNLYQPATGVLAWGHTYGVYAFMKAGSSNIVTGNIRLFVTQVAAKNRLRSISLDPSTGVDMGGGNFTFNRVDIDVASPSGLLAISRTYNSSSTISGAFGPGWSSLLDQRAEYDAAKPGLWLYLADGSAEFYGKNSDGTYGSPIGSVATTVELVGTTKWRVTDANETLFDYDSTGRLISITDREGHGITLSARGTTSPFAQTITDNQSGRTLTITWTGNTLTDTVTTVSTQPVSGQTLTWRYGYSGTGKLNQVCDPRDNALTTGKCEKYGYGSTRLTTITKIGRTSPSITIDYYLGRVMSWTDALSHTITYTDPVEVAVAVPGAGTQTFKQVTVTDARGNTIVEQYDNAERIVHRIDQAGKQRWWEYNTAGLLSKQTDETGATEAYLYDADGNQTQRTDALGHVWTATYDATHRPLTRLTPEGTITNSYDSTAANSWKEEMVPATTDQPTSPAAARTTRTETTLGTETAYPGPGLMPKGLLHRTIDPLGRITVMDYDSKGDLRRLTDPAGKVTLYTYDEIGRETSRTATWLDGDAVPRSATWSTTWTVLSQKASETEPAVVNQAASPTITHQRKTEWTFDDRSNITLVRDRDLTGGDSTRDTMSEFDLLDRTWRVTDSGGGVTTSTYDENSNAITVTDPLGRVYTTTYDARNMPSSVTLTNYNNPVTGGAAAAKLVKSMTYNDRGQIDVETDALGRQVQHRYDATGREYQTELVSYTKPDGSTISPFVLHYVQFDALGRPIREDNGNGMARVDRTFDARGRKVDETYSNTGSQDRKTTTHYNPVSSITSQIVSCPTACSLSQPENRTVYDSIGRPVQQIIENGSNDLITVTQYDQAGNAVRVTDPRGTANPASPLAAYTVTSKYDFLGRVSQVTSPSVNIDVKGSSTTAGQPTETTGYDTFGEVTDSSDANGNHSTSTFDTSGRNTTITHPTYTPPGASAITPVETFSFDLVGNMTSRVDRLGQTWTFEFDSFNQAVRQTAPKPTPGGSNPVTISAFDAVGNLTSATDPTGAVTNYTYDNLNRQRTVAQVVRPYGGVGSTQTYTTQYDYDTLGHLTSTTDPSGAVTTQVWSPVGDLLQRTLPASGAGIARTTMTYDLSSRVMTTTDPLGRAVTNVYDTAGRVATVEHYASAASGGALLSTNTFAYDKASNRTSSTTPEGDTTTYTFDALNQLRTVTVPTEVAPRAWWKLGNTAGTTATDSGTNGFNGTFNGTYTLNQTGAPNGITNPSVSFAGGNVDVPVAAVTGSTRSYAVWFKTSGSGVLLSKENAASGTTPTSFTPLIYVGTDGKLRAGTSPTALITSPSTVNNNAWHRAALNITPESVTLYLDGSKLLTIAAPTVNDSWATKAYIATGYTAGYPATTGGWMPFAGLIDEVGTQDQPLKAVETGTYAAAQIHTPGTIATTYGYDSAGNPTKVVDGKGSTWWTTYNTWNLPESQIEPSKDIAPVEPETNRTFTVVYNAAGLVTDDRQPGAITITNTYDQLGRITAQTGIGAAGSRSFAYDQANHIAAASHPTGTITYAYDDRGLLRAAGGPAGTATFDYNANGQLSSRTDAAGTATFTYTTRGELYALAEPATGRTLINTYNDASQPTGVNYNNGAAGAATRTYTYDARGRLATDTLTNTSAAVTASTTYTYDRNNQLIAKTTGPSAVADNGTNRYFYDRAGRLNGWQKPDNGFNQYVYDDNGNRTKNNTLNSTYDQRNRLLTNETTSYTWNPRGTLASSTIGGVTTNFAYDAFGELTSTGTLSLTYDALGRPAARTNGATTNFTYTGAAADPTADGTFTYTRTPGGLPVAIAQGATKSFTALNGHGDVATTHTTSGALAASKAYDPYGVPTATTGSNPSIGYQADWTDPTNGLVNMGARWYQPTTATFVSRDTNFGRLDTPVSLNRYTYANNNPIGYFDPTGRYSADVLERMANEAKAATQAPSARNITVKPSYASGSADNMARQIATHEKANPIYASADSSAAIAEIARNKAVAEAIHAMITNYPTPPPPAAAPHVPVPYGQGSPGGVGYATPPVEMPTARPPTVVEPTVGRDPRITLPYLAPAVLTVATLVEYWGDDCYTNDTKAPAYAGCKPLSEGYDSWRDGDTTSEYVKAKAARDSAAKSRTVTSCVSNTGTTCTATANNQPALHFYVLDSGMLMNMNQSDDARRNAFLSDPTNVFLMPQGVAAEIKRPDQIARLQASSNIFLSENPDLPPTFPVAPANNGRGGYGNFGVEDAWLNQLALNTGLPIASHNPAMVRQIDSNPNVSKHGYDQNTIFFPAKP